MALQEARPRQSRGLGAGSYGGGYALAAALEPVASSMAVSGVATFSSDWRSALTPKEIRRGHQAFLEPEVERIKRAGGDVAKSHLRIGKPDEEILRCSEEIIAGMIVVGNQGIGQRLSRLRRFLMGSTSEKVTRYARCSVMVVRKDLYNQPPA